MATITSLPCCGLVCIGQCAAGHLHQRYRHQKQRILKGLKQRGIAVGEIFFPKSFQQTASKTCFLELKYYIHLFGKRHNRSPLRKLVAGGSLGFTCNGQLVMGPRSGPSFQGLILPLFPQVWLQSAQISLTQPMKTYLPPACPAPPAAVCTAPQRC